MGPPYKILIVEDDAHLRLSIRLSLERLAYAVFEATTGAEALALAEAEQPDLILLDLGLPDADGLEVAQELRRRPATTLIPIAVCTGQTVLGRRAEILARICAGTIPKPVTVERLERDLRLLLTMRRATGRRFPRYPVEAPIWWRPYGGRGGPETSYAAGMARTLSEGGLMVELPMPLARASLVDLRLRAPAGEVSALGKIVWSQFRQQAGPRGGSYQHGVQFINMDPAKLVALHSLLEGAGPAGE